MLTVLIPLENFGPVKAITLPDDWFPCTDEDNLHPNARITEFQNATCEAARICLLQKGIPVSPGACDAFRQMLSSEGKVASSALVLLTEVLGNQAYPDYFEMSSCMVQNVGGKPVLIVEGEWRSSEAKSISAFVLNESDRLVYEIYYLAPAKEFHKFASQGRAAINSVQWK